ncbi:glycerophosphodiester phosphodiesterase family protein [Alicyclobacillus sp.]|uniref:glycerophosphodiester phosphodiesterase n=1 Tax=Alicyclobacillus sp. TaxID=61169 RepID=UPI0025BCDD41|nr:glycerophosphodiester phosphodiesterase family protein [Alicyclobacillus sp.]MCL6516736.1 hypothetical protein [Alicyclobacillus sp.]
MSTKILAHRGWSARYPENTLTAFAAALTVGCDGLEFDVQLTADEVPVVLHDPTVDRTTDGTGRVSRLRFADIRQLNAAAGREGFHAVPTLEEVLQLAALHHPTGLYNIELKVHEGDGRALVNRVVPLVLAHPIGRRVLFSSFHHGCLAYLRSRHPEAAIGLLFEEPVLEPWLRAQAVGAWSVNAEASWARDVIEPCRRHGVHVCVWTVDDPVAMRRFFRQGTDVLISNVPDVALRVRKKV